MLDKLTIFEKSINLAFIRIGYPGTNEKECQFFKPESK